MKAAIVFFAASILGIVGVTEWRVKQAPATEGKPASLYIEPAGSGNLAEVVSVLGQVEPRTKVSISALLSLPIVALPFKEGDRVTKGSELGSTSVSASVLARLGDADLQAAVRAAEARRAKAVAEIEVARVRLVAQESQMASIRICLGEAERNWGRISQLMDKNLASQATGDEAHCKFERLKADDNAAARGYEAGVAGLTVVQQSLKAAEAELERARVFLGAATITAPIDGIVTRVNVKVGELVAGTISNPGTVLMEVADMDQMLLVARVDEGSIGKMKVGQKAMVRLQAYPGEVFGGVVENVALASTEEKDGARYFKTEIRLETGGRLIACGLSGEAKIETGACQSGVGVSGGVWGRASR